MTGTTPVPDQPDATPRPRSGRGRLSGVGLATGGLAAVLVGALGLAAVQNLTGTARTGTDTVAQQTPPVGSTRTPTPAASLTSIQPASALLTTFSGCDPLKAYYTKHALEIVGPYGLGGGPVYAMAAGGVADMAARSSAAGGIAVPAAAAPSAAGAAGAAKTEGTTPATGTNVQVAGVDEADVAKRVGDLVFVLAQNGSANGLRILRTGEATSTVVGRLTTKDWVPDSMLVDGGTLLLIGQAPAKEVPQPGGVPSGRSSSKRMAIMPVYRPTTRVAQVDVSDPARPRLVRTLDLTGSSVGARLVDGVVRLAVTNSVVDLPFVSPVYPQSDQPTATANSGGAATSPELTAPSPPSESQVKAAENAATAQNKKVIQQSGIGAWLPSYTLTESDGTTSDGALVDCADVSAPTSFAGIDTLTMLTLDLRGSGVQTWQSAAVVADGATLYATKDRTYIATSQWQNWGIMPRVDIMRVAGTATTQVHAFETKGLEAPRYLASGTVPGYLLNQFSMDEYNGDLRVATTSQPSFLGAGTGSSEDATTGKDSTVSSSQVLVLRLDGDHLTTVGKVGGLGKNEQIYSVRFIGPVGYVVTFRRTDPLYTIDLSDPSAPKVVGQVKILGYSAYLHPAGDGLLLGIGQDASEQGRATGLQMSLFDVSNPAEPRRVSQVTLPNTWSDAEADHHAFTFADGLALVPFNRQWWYGGPDQPLESAAAGLTAEQRKQLVAGVPFMDAGVLAVRVDGDRLGAPVTLRMKTDGPVRADVDYAQLAMPLRTFVDASIWTVTTSGLAAHDAKTLQRQAFTSF